jgi:repressor LexA
MAGTPNVRRLQVLAELLRYEEDRGYQPSLRELAEAVGLRSVSSVHAHVKGLEADGLVRRVRGRARSIELGEQVEHTR